MHVVKKVEQLYCGAYRPNIGRSWLESVDYSYLPWKVRKNLWWVYEMICTGAHLSFEFDVDLEVWLPRSPLEGISAVFAGEDLDGNVTTFDTGLRVVTDDVQEYLIAQGVSQAYVHDVIRPFLKGRSTGLRYRSRREFSYEKLSAVAGKSGSFMYCGGPSCVYMWAVQRDPGDEEDDLSWGGSYPPSAIPPLFFSTHLLGNERQRDWARGEGGRWAGMGKMRHVRGRPFLFPAGGRGEACPDWFRGLAFDTYVTDVGEATQHFLSTRFGRYYPRDLVERYARLTECGS
jgi:hypothetical protein